MSYLMVNTKDRFSDNRAQILKCHNGRFNLKSAFENKMYEKLISGATMQAYLPFCFCCLNNIKYLVLRSEISSS